MGKWTEKEAIISPYSFSDYIFLKTQHFVSLVSLLLFLYLVSRKFKSISSMCGALSFCAVFYFSLKLIFSHIDRKMNAQSDIIKNCTVSCSNGVTEEWYNSISCLRYA